MLVLHIHFLIAFTFWPTDGLIKLPSSNLNDELILAKTATNIAQKYFPKETTTVIVIERSLHVELRDFNKRIFEYILQNLNETITVQLYCGKSEYQPWEYHIIVIDSEMAFLNVTSSFPKNNYDGEFRFLVVLTHFSITDYVQTITGIFQNCRDNNVINVNVLLNHSSLGVCMYKYNIFSEQKCHAVQPYLQFRLFNGFEKLTEAFPKRLMNFHKCPLKICGQLNHPMLTFSGNLSDPKSVKNWDNLRGVDGELIKILSRHLNFTIDLVLENKSSVIVNDTGYGCFAKLLTEDSDIAIGGFSGSDPSRFAFTPSVLYHHSPIVIIVRGRRELDCVNRLGRPFSIAVWHGIIGLLLAGTLFIQILRIIKKPDRQLIIGEENTTPLLNFFSTFLGYPVSRAPKGILSRYLLILWLIMTLILRSAYQGSLYDSIRIDRFERVPKKYDELSRHHYKFIVSRYYLDIGIFPVNQTIIVDKMHSQRLKLVASLKGKYATPAIQDHVISYLESHYRNGSDLRIIDEQIYQFQQAMYFPKHSIYASPINENLNQFSYVGLMGHIVRKNTKDRRMFKERKVATPLRALTNDRIRSLYIIFVILMGLTMTVFVLELLSSLSVKLEIFLNWFH